MTYLRSKTRAHGRIRFQRTAYDRVYDAERPEIFFKAIAEKVVAAGEGVGIRRDATWSVPEPELALVLNSRGQIAGCTIGNDMSSRDIEGENLLYLPQAKVYDRSCALGPCIRLGASEADAREWTVRSTIMRDGSTVFSGGLASVYQAQLRRASGLFVPLAIVSAMARCAHGYRHRATRRLHASRARRRRN